MAQENQALVLTEAVASHPIERVDRFVLVLSEPFSALLCGQATGTIYQTELTFTTDSIRLFAQQLLEQHPLVDWSESLKQQLATIGPNHPTQQSQFTLKLVSLLTMPSHCQPAETALWQQIQQERLLNQVTSQIRQSLELPIILRTAVEQVRQFLQADRLVIYQFNAPSATPLSEFDLPMPDPALVAGETFAGDETLSETVGGIELSKQFIHASENPEQNIEQNFGQGAEQSARQVTPYGSVIYEARASDQIPSVMHLSDAHCFVQELRHKDWRLLEIADAIEDVEVSYNSIPCLLEFLRRAQVRAKLIAPIRLQDQLWGLLIAHECSQPRRWQDSERRFLQQIAENLAIAISQAQLFAEVQQQKQTLEQRVIERTQDLRDALLTAQSANRTKSEFLAAVSHELRTPLACIIGMSATLQRWSKDVLTPRQQNFLKTIHESGEHLLSLINDILDLSQAEAGRMILNLQPISLTGIAQQTLKAFEGQASLQEVELELDLRIEPQRDSFVADPRRVRQILFNLLSNAIKFTSPGGKVTLRAFVQPELAIFQVKDTGIGIPEPQLPLLFQKFQQLDSSYHREYQGTGLGLALTKQLVELHGGWIEVESTVGVGSVFTVKLPVQQNHLLAGTGQTAKFDQSISSQGRIVLVDPNEDSANFVCDLLLAAGYQVIWLLEGAAALNQLEVLLPAAVILNVRLPDMDGSHLIRSLRQNPSTKHLKVLALVPNPPTPDSPTATVSITAGNHEATRAQQWQAIGANEVLQHPIHPEALLQTVRAFFTDSD
ncbi:GAF domain-containing protein [Leptolyngbya sp. NK1-12]|uniref:histidine kinase n=2 Tax=Leptolyngbya sp. NK1-12 TaxID=2547451 RepID=A0AA97AN90_9CYAN|nr:GAF domain-containing protein [Leptolyngbya sp. NK1-12]